MIWKSIYFQGTIALSTAQLVHHCDVFHKFCIRLFHISMNYGFNALQDRINFWAAKRASNVHTPRSWCWIEGCNHVLERLMTARVAFYFLLISIFQSYVYNVGLLDIRQ